MVVRPRPLAGLVNGQVPVWHGRTVLVTGHTGFKGGWLSLMLHRLGARVHGFALPPPTVPNLFELARVDTALAGDHRGDVNDVDAVREVVRASRPSVVFHLAAQPLVRAGYREPLATFATNVMGTAYVLDAVRDSETVRAVVVVTTDKVYDNREWPHPYREPDPLGGHEPYGASKAAAELVVAAYRASFFAAAAHSVRLASARAGNVVGGGDFAPDRLVPDCLRAFAAGQPVVLRNPAAVRPWQHVLEPLSGYLRLAEGLLGPGGAELARAWNFGPDVGGDATVGEVARRVAELWGRGATVLARPAATGPAEAGLLRLDSSLARHGLGWTPRWSLDTALARTVAWHEAAAVGQDLHALTLAQIDDYARGCHG